MKDAMWWSQRNRSIFFLKKGTARQKLTWPKKMVPSIKSRARPEAFSFFFHLILLTLKMLFFLPFSSLYFTFSTFFFYFLPFFSLSSIEIDRFCVVVVVFFRCCTPTMCGATMFSWSIEFYRVVFFWRGIDFYRVRVALLGRTVFFLVTGFCNIYRVFF